MLKRAMTLLVTAALTLPACATTAGPRLQTATVPAQRTGDQRLVAEYVQKLPVGSRVRVHLRDGRRERGTLMDATAERLVLLPRTRIPEPPREIPFDRVLGVEIENGNGSGGVGRAIGIGIAAGAGAVLGFMLFLAAIYAD
jgi:hypothetical protein